MQYLVQNYDGFSIAKSLNKSVSHYVIDSELTDKTKEMRQVKERHKKGILEIAPSSDNPYIFLHGQSKLLEDSLISKDLDQIRKLFDDIENKSSFIDILENTDIAKGVQIFIGSQNFLFKHSGFSMVMAPYKDRNQKIIGAIGVVGPTRLDYAKIVPLVDYTSKVIGKVLS